MKPLSMLVVLWTLIFLGYGFMYHHILYNVTLLCFFGACVFASIVFVFNNEKEGN